MPGKQSRGYYRYGLAPLLVLVLAFASSGVAYAQLTAQDIQALKERGEREGWTFTVTENPATRRSLDDLCGFFKPEGWEALTRWDDCRSRTELPVAFDWRSVGGCTVVKDQGWCGSCWAFATVGPLECNIRIKDDVIVDLSEQWLVSCNSDGWSCDGGFFAHNYHEWKTDSCNDTGAVPEPDFPYVANDVPCNCPYSHEYFIDDWAYISGGVEALKQAILDYGPISVTIYANSALQSYGGGIFDGCNNDEPINHAVVLVGWDDNQGPNGVWIMRNSWSVFWGENGGYARIPYECSRIGETACYIVYPGNTPTLTYEYPSGQPQLIAPGVETRTPVNVYADSGTPVPGTGWLHYSRNGAGYFVVALDVVGVNQYEAVLPASNCYSDIRWYVSVQEMDGRRISDPPSAPAYVHSTTVASEHTVLFEDDFETDQGWSVYAGAATGNWERADPQEVLSGEMITQPEYDHTPVSSLCYVTGPMAGLSDSSYDVDGEPSRLTSPVLDLEDVDATVSYWRWYHISAQQDDELVVEVSNNDGSSWTTVEVVDDRTEWTHVDWKVSDYVTPTSEVRVRFTVGDSPDNSIVEALIDDFKVEVLACQMPSDCPEDLSGDDVIDLADLAILLANYGQSGGPEDGDLDGNGTIDLPDLSQLLSVYGTDCP